MKYFLIAGEASGDLHGSNLMKEIKACDTTAEFRYFGGDLMAAQGGTLVKHYRDMAYMGFIPVLLHLRTIMNNLKACQKDIVNYCPDVLILIDYPGFNLKVAKFIKTHTHIPVFYYISPKVWAWKEYRVKSFKKYVDEMFSILPFEPAFFEKHRYTAHYIGNPSVDSVSDYLNQQSNDSKQAFLDENKLSDKPIIALLAGSRKHEIATNLPPMLEAIETFGDYQFVIAGAPGIDRHFYDPYLSDSVRVLFDQTYRILRYAQAALVTSGTATLETALFRVPQVVCYKTVYPRISGWAFRHILHTTYISLVNLIANKPVVKELFAESFSVKAIEEETKRILYDISYRNRMLADYDEMAAILGRPGASEKAATEMIKRLKTTYGKH